MRIARSDIYRSQAAAPTKRTTSDGSNAVRYGYRSQTAATVKRPTFDGSNAISRAVVGYG